MPELLREAIASCLASAFSSREWACTPMPLGSDADPQSSRGIIAELATRAEILLASVIDEGSAEDRLIGCALGAILDQTLIAAYRLAPYDAEDGDGLLAYFGIVPCRQGTRVVPLPHGAHGPDDAGSRLLSIAPAGRSLARALFAAWLELPAIRRCPRVFVRTREVISSVQRLSRDHGFELCGKFSIDFQGEHQDRIVFRRSSTAATSLMVEKAEVP